MSTYAKKTCNICGLRDIQPNMYRRKKSVKAYTSKDKIGAGTMIGFAFDNKASRRRVNKALFANNKRSHTAHREVWMCYECSGVADEDRTQARREDLREAKRAKRAKRRTSKLWDFCWFVVGISFLAVLVLSHIASGA